jgi:Holliday junction resolvase
MHIDGAIIADIAKAAAATALSHVTRPHTEKMLRPLLALLETSGAEVLRAASGMEFELHWPETITVDARQTMRAQLKDEMRAQAMLTIEAQCQALVEFQVRCASAVLNAITDRMKGAIG